MATRHRGEKTTLALFDEALREHHQSKLLVGVDEVGRGPLAGPVVAAAVVLDPGIARTLVGIRDSKALTPARRGVLFDVLREKAAHIGVGWSTVQEIDGRNILQATLEAMKRAVARLRLPCRDGVLVAVDGNAEIPGLPFKQCRLVRGDAFSLSIASASIVAKVIRDRWMRVLDRRHPGYGFSVHKGYGTAAHLEALGRLGPCPVHRRTFAPVAQAELPLKGPK